MASYHYGADVDLPFKVGDIAELPFTKSPSALYGGKWELLRSLPVCFSIVYWWKLVDAEGEPEDIWMREEPAVTSNNTCHVCGDTSEKLIGINIRYPEKSNDTIWLCPECAMDVGDLGKCCLLKSKRKEE